MTSSALPVFVEADNALGSSRGDVDDGFALGALLRHAAPLLAIGSVFGNTSEAEAARNNRDLAAALQADVPHVRGAPRAGASAAETVDFLAAVQRPFRWLALGPLTTVAALLAKRPEAKVAEIVLVGGDRSSRGRWPPLWPYEFNLRLDRRAAVAVFASPVPITVVPIDVARRLTFPRQRLANIPGPFGERVRRHAGRWFDRAKSWFRRDAIRLYDLLAAAHVLRPDWLHYADSAVRMHRRGWLQFGAGERRARVVVDFLPTLLDLLDGAAPLPHRTDEPRSRSPVDIGCNAPSRP